MSKSFLSELAKGCEREKCTKKRGYFDNWADNVFKELLPSGENMQPRFQEMFDKGNGNELKDKAKAIHSSSMLAYNFFHWVSQKTPLTLFGKTFMDVAFEVKLPCLKRGSPANLDVALLGEDRKSVLFLESKFTEHFHNRTFSMSGSYHNSDCYANKSSWLSVVESVERLVEGRMKPEKNYYEGIKQCVCHLIAIDRLRDCQKCLDKLFLVPLNSKCSFDFATIVFEPNGAHFKKEHDAFNEYRNLFDVFVETVNEQKVTKDDLFWNPANKRKHPGFLTYGDVWTDEDAKKSMPANLRDYLFTKYMKLSATFVP